MEFEEKFKNKIREKIIKQIEENFKICWDNFGKLGEEYLKDILQDILREIRSFINFYNEKISDKSKQIHFDDDITLDSIMELKRKVTVSEEEKEYIENYIYIERFKYRGDFQLIWDVDESLWVYRLPKLLLQPVVENALIHGISAKENGGIIQVKIYYQEDCVVVKVMDNGKGMSEEQVKRLLADIRKKDITGFRRVGLANVLNRIRLIYGDEYGGTVYSCQDMFTCVELKLPAPKR